MTHGSRGAHRGSIGPRWHTAHRGSIGPRWHTGHALGSRGALIGVPLARALMVPSISHLLILLQILQTFKYFHVRRDTVKTVCLGLLRCPRAVDKHTFKLGYCFAGMTRSDETFGRRTDRQIEVLARKRERSVKV